MPIFDYICPNCNNMIKDVIILSGSNIDDRVKDGKVFCDKCNTECKKMIPNNTNFKLEGEGWTPKFGK
jgi:predicted nucleic acid-binding Zn ribbon protein